MSKIRVRRAAALLTTALITTAGLALAAPSAGAIPPEVGRHEAAPWGPDHGAPTAVDQPGVSPAMVPAGILDTTWSGDGVATLQTKYYPSLGPQGIDELGVALYKDGDGGQFRFWKLAHEGAPKPGFGTGGSILRRFGTGGVNFPEIVLPYGTQSVVVGSYATASVARLGVTRLLEDGSYRVIGSTPGHNTYKVFALEHDYLLPFSATVLDNGRLMVGVAAFDRDSDGDLQYVGQAVARMNNNGSLDTTFSSDGVLPVAKDVNDIDFGSTGTVFMGRVNGVSHEVRKFRSNGTLDPTFSGDGTMIAPCGAHQGANIKSLPGGKVFLLCGRSFSATTADLRTIRVNADGTLDSGYSGNGMAPWVLTGIDTEQLYGQIDGQTGEVQMETVTAGDDHQLQVHALTANGDPNLAYGPAGRSTINLTSAPILLNSELATGRIIVASGRGTSSLDLLGITTD